MSRAATNTIIVTMQSCAHPSNQKAIILGGKGIVGSALHSIMVREKWSCQIIDKEQAIDQKKYLQLLRKSKKQGIWIVDLIPNLPKAWSARMAGQYGHNYINTTSLNGKPGLCEFLSILDGHSSFKTNAKILLSAGANPGIVNIFGEKLVREFGQPDTLISWEYDENTWGDRAIITWNKGEFLEECATGYWPEPQHNGTIKFNKTRPCDKLKELPNFPHIPPNTKGMVTPHEECIMLGWRHQCKSYFYYAFTSRNPLLQAIRKGDAIFQCRKSKGADTVGMTWKKGREEHTISARKETIAQHIPSNTTGWLVASGIMAAIKSAEEIDPGCYIPEDLPRDKYLCSLEDYCDITKN